MADETIRIRQIRSAIGTNQRVRETLKGLGLGRIGAERVVKRSAAIDGMIKRLAHLVAEVK